jgi:hypothetical protein
MLCAVQHLFFSLHFQISMLRRSNAAVALLGG